MHDGPAVTDDHLFLTYTQIIDPHNPDYYESFSCQAIYSKENMFADPATVKVRNYYGQGRFAQALTTTTANKFRDINFEDLVDDKN